MSKRGDQLLIMQFELDVQRGRSRVCEVGGFPGGNSIGHHFENNKNVFFCLTVLKTCLTTVRSF